MTEPLSHTAVAGGLAGLIAGWAAAIGAVLATAGACYAGIRTGLRRFSKWAGAWRDADRALEQARIDSEATLNERVSTLAANHIHDLEAFRLAFESRMIAHEAKDDERLTKVHERLDFVAGNMSTKGDAGRIEGKLDQLLTGLALERSAHRNR